jgi:hypothetical protein
MDMVGQRPVAVYDLKGQGISSLRCDFTYFDVESAHPKEHLYFIIDSSKWQGAMAVPHETFHYQTLDAVAETASGLHAFLPLSEEITPLFAPLRLGARTCENRIPFSPWKGQMLWKTVRPAR